VRYFSYGIKSEHSVATYISFDVDGLFSALGQECLLLNFQFLQLLNELSDVLSFADKLAKKLQCLYETL